MASPSAASSASPTATEPAPISRYPVPSLDELPDDLAERIRAVAERTGFVPNVMLGLAHRPAELRAFLAYHEALMEDVRPDSSLSKADREMIVVATSAANSCLYCVVAHGAILRIRSKNPLLADQVAVNHRTADLDDRQREICDVAVRFARAPEAVTEADWDRLRAVGLSDEDIWDVGAIVGLFALSNRMAHVTAMRPNDEFFTMGR
jgi:uncharacterized peroxidase-related enzyme